MDNAIVIGGGQAGLGAAYALRNQGFSPIVLEAGAEPVGSWPHYYDSLTIFTPARLSRLPGMPFPARAAHLPSRDEMVAYLRTYAARLDCEIRTGSRVTAVHTTSDGFEVTTETGEALRAPVVVAATGTFGNPHRPDIPGLAAYTGKVLHSAEYRSPEPFAGQRVVVVGAANSAIQIAHEIAGGARTTLTSRRPVRYTKLKPPSSRASWKALETGLLLPVGAFIPLRESAVVVDNDDIYRKALKTGFLDRRELFTAADGTDIRWADGTTEHVDTVFLATGYRPAVEYLRPIGALDHRGIPRQRSGMSTVHPGLAFVGLEGQRSLLSGGIHGVGTDATHVARRLRRWLATTEPAWRRPAA
ncbi:NAD(P)-binding domain-containing protein [Streptomyces sp. NPDC006798]|uniref:flavin-containing monooxygenase n=1 Tax=Streptomyces sp. NPDC006798 TaxID=3155462 RepID=UPI0034088CA1